MTFVEYIDRLARNDLQGLTPEKEELILRDAGVTRAHVNSAIEKRRRELNINPEPNVSYRRVINR